MVPKLLVNTDLHNRSGAGLDCFKAEMAALWPPCPRARLMGGEVGPGGGSTVFLFLTKTIRTACGWDVGHVTHSRVCIAIPSSFPFPLPPGASRLSGMDLQNELSPKATWHRHDMGTAGCSSWAPGTSALWTADLAANLP